ncbi:hypothetical protein JW960_27310 [candidate division KSB1 bacterium]|nr:hypothetical protein [candidate division KSB1 bacterium]
MRDLHTALEHYKMSVQLADGFQLKAQRRLLRVYYELENYPHVLKLHKQCSWQARTIF